MMGFSLCPCPGGGACPLACGGRPRLTANCKWFRRVICGQTSFKTQNDTHNLKLMQHPTLMSSVSACHFIFIWCPALAKTERSCYTLTAGGD